MAQDRNHTNAAAAIGWIAATLLAYLTFLIVRPFLAPLGWAVVVAVVFHPIHARLERRWGSTRAALATTVLVAVIVTVPLSVIATAFVNEALEAVHDLQTAVVSGRVDWIKSFSDRILQGVPVANRPDLAAAVADAAQRGAIGLAGYSGTILRNTATFVFDLVLALFASFFLLRDGSALAKVVRNLIPLEPAARDRLMDETAELIGVGVRSSLLVAGLQGALGGLVFAAVGIDAPVFWGVVMGWLCLLPFGAWVVWLPAATVLIVSGHIARGLILAGLGFGIVSAIDNVLRPILLAERTSMNGLLVFISLLGGMAAFGALGLVFGPVVMATATAMINVYADSQAPESERPQRIATRRRA